MVFRSGQGITFNREEIANNAYLFLRKISDIWDLLFQEIPSAQKIDISYATINGMMSKLDSYSSFKDPEKYSKFEDLADGDFGGIGIELTIIDDRLTIVSPIEETPAFRKGLRPNDTITAINGQDTDDMSLEDASLNIRGPKGTSVTLTILHETASNPVDVTLVREAIAIYTVKTRQLVQGYHYLRIMNFLLLTKKQTKD